MKKNYLFPLLLFISTNIIAQEVADNGYIGISLAPSIPNGNYASVDDDNEKAGFATTGIAFDLSLAYKLGKNFGIAAVLMSMSNPYDEPAATIAAFKADTGIAWTIDADSWSHGGIMIGAFCSFPIRNSHTVFETRLLLGAMSATLPQISKTGKATASPYHSNSGISESISAGYLAVLLGGNFRFMANKKISILTGIDIYKGSAEFPNVETTYEDGSSTLNTFTQSFSTVKISFGVAYRLGTKVEEKK